MSCQKEGDMGKRLEDTVREAQDTSRGRTQNNSSRDCPSIPVKDFSRTTITK